MKSRTPLLALMTAGSLMLAGSLMAQDQTTMPPPPPPAPAAPAAPMPPPAPMPANAGTQGSAQFNTAQGQVTINSVVPPVNAGPAPSFEQLSGGSRYITEEQASAYPLLANDFSYVDKGHTGHITRTQYEAWVNKK